MLCLVSSQDPQKIIQMCKYDPKPKIKLGTPLSLAIECTSGMWKCCIANGGHTETDYVTKTSQPGKTT